MRCIVSSLLLILAMSVAWAQRSQNGIDPTDLDYDTNLVVPEVPAKQHHAIVNHLKSIKDALDNLKFKTELKRDGEVLSVIIPCADLFAPNDTVLKALAKSRLQHFSKFLQYPTMYKIVVAVFTDNTGEPQYLDALSSARANAIDEYLIEMAQEKGYVNPNVIPYGMADSYQVLPNSTIHNRAANRRVEIQIIPEWQMIETAKSGKL